MGSEDKRTAAGQGLDADVARRRVVITNVAPEIAGGRYPAKRARGGAVRVEADIFADSHDALAVLLLYRRQEDARWGVVPMRPMVNDRWYAVFPVETLGRYRFTLQAWIDRFKTWRRDLQKKAGAGQDVAVDLLAGAELEIGRAHV